MCHLKVVCRALTMSGSAKKSSPYPEVIVIAIFCSFRITQGCIPSFNLLLCLGPVNMFVVVGSGGGGKLWLKLNNKVQDMNMCWFR